MIPEVLVADVEAVLLSASRMKVGSLANLGYSCGGHVPCETDMTSPQEAYLMSLSGVTEQQIAEQLGISLDTARDWIARGSARFASACSTDAEFVDIPVEAAHHNVRSFVLESTLKDPSTVDVAEAPDLVGEADVGVGVWDALAHLFSDVVDESVGVIRNFPGVDMAVREDTDYIAVYGHGIDVAGLQSMLTDWWAERSRRLLADLEDRSGTASFGTPPS